LKVRLGIIALAGAFGVFCIALGNEAGFLQGRYCAGWYVASCAFIGIVSQGLAKPCSSNLSVFPQTEAEPVVGFADGRRKWGFSAAFREETLYLVAPSYAEHSVFTGLGEIKQPCFRSLSDWILARTVFNVRHLRGKIYLHQCEQNRVYACLSWLRGDLEVDGFRVRVS